ncbi:MAG: putative holin-like toxin [Tepidanaerobacteraceae bacterium]|nr:putative holin-like toxin [Tepidanaerobacteraceae bacterium]
MSTYEAVHLMVSASMLTVSLISLIIVLIKAISKGKKQSPCLSL